MMVSPSLSWAVTIATVLIIQFASTEEQKGIRQPRFNVDANDTRFTGCSSLLIGNGGCRGENWDGGDWPKAIKGDKSLDECCQMCMKDAECKGFHLVKSKKPNATKRPCLLFGHQNLVAVKGLGGECYQVQRGTVKTMDNVRGHFAAFVAFKTKNQCHTIILLFETLQFLFIWNFCRINQF